MRYLLCFSLLLHLVQCSSHRHHECGIIDSGQKLNARFWSVGVYDKTLNQFLCTAALVSPLIAITSGECGELLHNKTHVVSVVTAHGGEASPQRYIKDVKIHHNFINDEMDINSISVLTLSEPFANHDHVRYLCLPSPHEKYHDGNCIFVGFGNAKGLANFTIDSVRQEDVVILPHPCDLPGLQQEEQDQILKHKELLCVGGPKYNGGCAGDNGATLACKSTSRPVYVLAGVLAYGPQRFGCNEVHPEIQGTKFPDFYTSVRYHAEWLQPLLKNAANSKHSSRHLTIFVILAWCVSTIMCSY